MATLPTYFRDFLSEIRPTPNQARDMKVGHSAFRKRLAKYEDLKPILVSDFLQGSYRRATAVRPHEGKRSDVDIVVVTNLARDDTDPTDALERFRPFVKKYYQGKYHFQGRSIAIELSYVDLDLVVTSAPSEEEQEALRWAAVRSYDTPEDVSDWRFNRFWLPTDDRDQLGAQSRLFKAEQAPQWKSEPLWIPDRDADEWEPTHPLAQILWTHAKNKATNGHFVNIVKTIKWWRRLTYATPKHPKGYPLEHIVGDCCPGGAASVAEGVTLTLEAIRDRFATYASEARTPFLRDRGVDQNVLERLSGDDFKVFHGHIDTAAGLARRALDEADVKKSAELWRDLLGDRFPEPPSGGGGTAAGGSTLGGFTEPSSPETPRRERFA